MLVIGGWHRSQTRKGKGRDAMKKKNGLLAESRRGHLLFPVL